LIFLKYFIIGRAKIGGEGGKQMANLRMSDGGY